ncbi:hypothetical protein [Streptomyces sp. NPDC008150]|uniref:hypothetical protein n=1 Tax=Streptomyces sp. NPDC008150 TaxID=3364816 RepID=UPI0036EBE55E
MHGALGSQTGRGVLPLLRGIPDREGRAVILVSHDPSQLPPPTASSCLVAGRVSGEPTGSSAEDIAARTTKFEAAAPC